MNKVGLVEKIVEETGVSRKQASQMLEATLSAIVAELKKGNQVKLPGFGTFLTRTRHERGGVNPQNPEERIRIPEVKVAKFRTGKTLKDALKGND
ncbi:MAG: HU family DNA-binding protein [Patescibacteria group bacterium]